MVMDIARLMGMGLMYKKNKELYFAFILVRYNDAFRKIMIHR
jgi:hypothetical protein